MPGFEWHFELDQERHVVRLDHNRRTTRQVVSLDGEIVVDRTSLSNLAARHRFQIGSHECAVVIGRQYLTLIVEYDLLVDGKSVIEIDA